MRNFIEIGLGIILAFLFYSIAGKIFFALPLLFNFFSLIVLYSAIKNGEIYGACVGTIAGLIQDSFSIGVFGISGLAKTIMGYVAGYVSHKVNVLPYMRNLIFIFTMMVGETGLSYILYYFIYSEYVKEISPYFFCPIY